MARLAAGEGCNHISGDFLLTFGTKNIYNKNDIQINIFVTHFMICSNPGPIIVTLVTLLYSTCSTRTGSTSTTATSTRRWLATSSATSSLCVLATISLNRWGRVVFVHRKMNKSSLHFIHLVTQFEFSLISILLTFTQYAEHGNPVYYYYFNQVCLDIADLPTMFFSFVMEHKKMKIQKEMSWAG